MHSSNQFLLPFVFLFIQVSSLIAAQESCPSLQKVAAHSFSGNLVVANRLSGTLSFVSANKINTSVSVFLKDAVEPLYVATPFTKSEVWVSDRSRNSIRVLKLENDSVIQSHELATADGPFHTMATQDFEEEFPTVWTACDIANVTVVHDATTKRLLATIPVPQQIQALGARPHDVTVNFKYGFISYIGASDGNGYVASYDTRNGSFALLSLLKTRSDPHVAIRGSQFNLFIAAQGGQVLKVKVPSLEVVAEDLTQPSPHGMFLSVDGKLLYVTNIAEEGENAVVVYNTQNLSNGKCGSIRTSEGVPHNPVVTGDRLFIAHSLPTKDIVSSFSIDENGCPVGSQDIVRTGILPFGVAFVPEALTKNVYV